MSGADPSQAIFRPAGEDSDVNLVQLHGFGGSRHSFDGMHGMWPPEICPWSGDLFGHRATPWPVEVQDFDSAIRALVGQLRRIPSPRYALAYSMGARLALACWSVDPALFDAGLFVGVHPGLRSQRDRDERRVLDTERAQTLRRLGTEAFFESWDRQPMFRGRPAPTWRQQHEADALSRCLELLGLAEQPDLWRVVEGHVASDRLRLFVGDHDEKFRRLLGHLKPRLLPGRHDLVSTRPGALAQAAVEHLRTSARQPPAAGC